MASGGIFAAATGSSIHNPVTPQGSVLFTTCYDQSTSDRGNASLNSFQRHDLLFRRGAAAKYKHGNKLTNVKLKTFSTCHSVLKVLEELKTPIKVADVGKKVDNIYKQIQFVGVSINPMDATRGGDNYVSALVSGLFTLVNTGEQLIEAGDIVVWSCDNLKLCKDNVRMPMSTVPLRTEKTTLLQKFKEQLQFRTADPLVQRMYDKKECSEDDLARLFESVTNDINIDATNRVIGQAMSSAKPGGAFDILIGSQRR